MTTTRSRRRRIVATATSLLIAPLLVVVVLSATAASSLEVARGRSVATRPLSSERILAGPGSIMLVGDSLTHGGVGSHTWRYHLSRHLAASYGNGDFLVGPSDRPHEGGTADYAVPAGWDMDHAAQNGRLLDCYIDGLILHAPCGATRTAIDDLTEFRPDTIVLFLGTNDVLLRWSSSLPTDYAANARRYVSLARSVNPDIKILLVGTTPIADADAEQQRTHRELGTAVASVAAQMSKLRSPVAFVDAAAGYDPVAWTVDGVHPNSRGDRAIADSIVGELADAFGIGAPLPNGPEELGDGLSERDTVVQ